MALRSRELFIKWDLVHCMQQDHDGFDGDVCPICQGVPTEPVETPCGHQFCFECISTWLMNRYTCPFCRQELYDKKTIWPTEIKQLDFDTLDFRVDEDEVRRHIHDFSEYLDEEDRPRCARTSIVRIEYRKILHVVVAAAAWFWGEAQTIENGQHRQISGQRWISAARWIRRVLLDHRGRCMRARFLDARIRAALFSGRGVRRNRPGAFGAKSIARGGFSDFDDEDALISSGAWRFLDDMQLFIEYIVRFAVEECNRDIA